MTLVDGFDVLCIGQVGLQTICARSSKLDQSFRALGVSSLGRETIHSAIHSAFQGHNYASDPGCFAGQVFSILLHVVPHLDEEEVYLFRINSVLQTQGRGPWNPVLGGWAHHLQGAVLLEQPVVGLLWLE